MALPLSSHQERLWFIDTFERGTVYPHPPTYHNLPLVLVASGPLDPAAARAALARVVARHEVLRTRLVEEGARATSRIEPDAIVPWQETPLAADADVTAAIVAANTVPFDLANDVLLRAELFPTADHTYWLITLHHLIADQTTLDLLAAEIAAELRGESPSAPALQYPDFVSWQRDLSAAALEPLLLYWKWQLRGRLPPLELPTARPRAAVHAYAGARHVFTWDAATSATLREFAASLDLTFGTAALAGFLAVLHRYTGQEEIVIGTRAPNRRQPDTEALVGPLANLLALRQSFGGNLSFAAALATFARLHGDALEYQEMPFDPLVRALNPPKDMSRTALFDVLATCAESPPAELPAGPGLHLRRLDLNLGHGKYDLALHLEPQAEGSTLGTLTYNTDLYDEAFIAQLARHYGRLLTAAVASPATALADLPVLDAAEEHLQLVVWNDTAAEAPRDVTLAGLFLTQAARTPDHRALSHGDTHLTYAQLAAAAGRLATHLRAQGVGPETLVAVAVPRSPELVISLLAVLLAGGAYLPLDPEHPVERLRYTLADAQAAHLVTTAVIAKRLGPPAGITHLTVLDREATALAELVPLARAPADLRPDHLAYCIYTSGSTGRPKGMLIEHRQVVRLMLNDRSPFAFTATDVWTLFHSACFDFSVWELLGALLFGGRLIVVDAEVARDPAAFATLLAAEQVTVLNQTPSAFHQLTHALAHRGHPPLALHTVIFGGEALSPLHLRGFAAAYPAITLVNMFGITETTVHVTYHRVTNADITANRPAIGRPLPTTTTLLLDARQRLVPVGVPGEICVGGEGLGRSYLHRDELTRERFIAHPYAPGERLYRSGDLGRLTPDGCLLHLGRIDDQVQVRGFRVELGEIQTRLLQHPAVTAAEVLARDCSPGEVELVAYLVAPEAPSLSDLRGHVAGTLPDYMVPAHFVLLDSLPLTPNGKVDRRALPAPAAATTAAGPAFAAPHGKTEVFVAATFAALLPTSPAIGRDHHFFELGGHSLLAAQLVARVRQHHGIDLPLRHVFDAPTVAGFASVIDRARAAAPPPTPASAPIPRAARRGVSAPLSAS